MSNNNITGMIIHTLTTPPSQPPQVVRHAAQGTLADYVPDNRQDHTLPDPRMDVACEDVIGQFARACQLGVSGGRGGGEGGRGRGSGGAGGKRKAEGEGEEVGEGEVMR